MTDRLQQAAAKALTGDISRADYSRYWRAVMRERVLQGVDRVTGDRLVKPPLTVVEPPPEKAEHVECQAYSKHTSFHRRAVDGWICDRCTAEATA